MEFNVVIGGEAGQGLFSVELGLTEILSRLNYYFFATKNYMSRIRGGHNFHMIRISEEPVHALSGRKWDMVIALDEETEIRHRPDLSDDGIYLSRELTKEIEKEAREKFQDVKLRKHDARRLRACRNRREPRKSDGGRRRRNGKILEGGFRLRPPL